MVRTLAGLSLAPLSCLLHRLRSPLWNTHPATIMSQDGEAPLVAVVLENLLGAAAALLRQRYQETLLLLVKQGLLRMP